MVKLARCCLCCVASNAAIDDVRKPFNTAIVLATCYKSVFDLRSLQLFNIPIPKPFAQTLTHHRANCTSLCLQLRYPRRHTH